MATGALGIEQQQLIMWQLIQSCHPFWIFWLSMNASLASSSTGRVTQMMQPLLVLQGSHRALPKPGKTTSRHVMPVDDRQDAKGHLKRMNTGHHKQLLDSGAYIVPLPCIHQVSNGLELTRERHCMIHMLSSMSYNNLYKATRQFATYNLLIMPA